MQASHAPLLILRALTRDRTRDEDLVCGGKAASGCCDERRFVFAEM